MRMLYYFGITAISQKASLWRHLRIGAEFIVSVYEFEEILPILSDLFVHLAHVLHLTDYDLPRGMLLGHLQEEIV